MEPIMQIVADENIPLLDEFFAGFCEIRRMPGRAIDAAAVADAELLLVRSVTRVDRALLDGSAVRFVGTCTIGTDHLDLDYFARAGIGWASAPGCNARGAGGYWSAPRRASSPRAAISSAWNRCSPSAMCSACTPRSNALARSRLIICSMRDAWPGSSPAPG